MFILRDKLVKYVRYSRSKIICEALLDNQTLLVLRSTMINCIQALRSNLSGLRRHGPIEVGSDLVLVL